MHIRTCRGRLWSSLWVTLCVSAFAGGAQASECSDPHAEILAAQATFEEPEDALRTVGCWSQAFEATGDRRGIFAFIYAEIIERILDQSARGFFRDRAWMRSFVTQLAELYRNAQVNYELERGPVPESWRLAFETSAEGDALVIQELLLGINAHYNYDLALALARAGVHENVKDRRRDYLALNQILTGAIDDFQDRLARDYAPGLGRLDATFAGADEVLAATLVHAALDFAWVNARRTDIVGLWWVRWELSHFSGQLARLIRLPNYFEPVMRKLREMERGS